MPTSLTCIIATRDRPEMVREAIASVWAQDHSGPVEIVVVHDRSEPDLSLAQCEGDRRVRVIVNERSAGLAGARNTGLLAATGDYVAFLDDDDLWLPDKVRRQLAALTEVPDAALVTGGIRVRYDGAEFDRCLSLTRVSFSDLLRDRHTELHPSTFLFRRDLLLDAVGLVDEEVPGGFGEDYELLLRTARHHDIVNLPEPVSIVRWGKQSFFFRRWETMAAGLSWLLEHYPEFATSARGAARLHGQVAFAHAASGDRGAAFRSAGQAVRRRPLEPRIYLAAAVALRLVSAHRVMESLHRRGRGI